MILRISRGILLGFIFGFMAQQANAGLGDFDLESPMSAGLYVVQPVPHVKTIKAYPWPGIIFRYDWLQIHYNAGILQFQDSIPAPNYAPIPTLDSVYATVYGVQAGLGLHLPIGFLCVGYKQLGISPFIDPEYSFTGARMGAEGNPGRFSIFGLSAAPGIAVKFPLFSVSAKYNVAYHFYMKDDDPIYIDRWGHYPASRRDRIAYQAFSGFTFYPSFSLEFNGMQEILGAESQKQGESYDDGHRTSTWTETSSQDLGNGFALVTATTYRSEYYETPRWVEMWTVVQRPFLSISSSLALRPPVENKGMTLLPTFGLSLRAAMIAVDLAYGNGILGMNGPPDAALKNYYTTQQYTAGIALDAWNPLMVLQSSTLDLTDTKSKFGDTQFFRMLFGWKFGMANFFPQYPYEVPTTAGAAGYLPPRAMNRFIHSPYIMLELANCGVFWEYLYKEKFPYADGSQFGINWKLPLWRW